MHRFVTHHDGDFMGFDMLTVDDFGTRGFLTGWDTHLCMNVHVGMFAYMTIWTLCTLWLFFIDRYVCLSSCLRAYETGMSTKCFSKTGHKFYCETSSRHRVSWAQVQSENSVSNPNAILFDFLKNNRSED